MVNETIVEASVNAIDVVSEPPCTFEGTANERELIEKAKTDRDALATLYKNYLPTIASYVGRRVGSRHEVEDIVANVFLTMVRALRQYRCGKAPFAAWLYRIATNEINRSIRKRRIRSFFGLGETILDQRKPAEAHEELRIALLELPLTYQVALSLHYLEQFSVNEAAVIIGVAPGTVKSRLARGRELLRRKLREDIR
jgi:RNA polymerase sigma-70 factor, ECF subfamily